MECGPNICESSIMDKNTFKSTKRLNWTPWTRPTTSMNRLAHFRQWPRGELGIINKYNITQYPYILNYIYKPLEMEPSCSHDLINAINMLNSKHKIHSRWMKLYSVDVDMQYCTYNPTSDWMDGVCMVALWVRYMILWFDIEAGCMHNTPGSIKRLPLPAFKQDGQILKWNLYRLLWKTSTASLSLQSAPPNRTQLPLNMRYVKPVDNERTTNIK